MDMRILSVVTSPSIFHGFSTRKRFWKENFTGEENFTLCELSAVNIKNCGRSNVTKHRDIKSSDKYVTLNILLNFNSLDKIRITSSESKFKLGISGKGLLTSLGQVKKKAKEILKGKVCHQKCQ